MAKKGMIVAEEIAVPVDIAMAVTSEEVSAEEEASAPVDPVKTAITEKGWMVKAEALTIPDEIVLAPITKEEEEIRTGGRGKQETPGIRWMIHPSTSATSLLPPWSPLVGGRRKRTEEVLFSPWRKIFFFWGYFPFFVSFSSSFFSFFSQDVGHVKEAAWQQKNIFPIFNVIVIFLLYLNNWNRFAFFSFE